MVRYIIAITLALLLLSACADFTSGPRFKGDVYTIAGLLVAGQSISSEYPVYITRSADIESFDPMNIFVTEADVRITETFEGEIIKTWNLRPIPDFVEFKIKWVDEAANVILPEHTYHIEVSVPGYGKTITAETTVPPAVELNPDYYGHNVEGEGYSFTEAQMGYVVHSNSDTRYPLALNTGSRSETRNLVSELFCLEPFSTDLEFTTPVFGQTNASANLEDSYYGEGEGFRRVMIMGRFAPSIHPEHQDNYILVRNFRQGFIFYGRYRVKVYITDDNYYKYKYMSEGYLHGGVQNGLGYFGSASGGVMYVNVVKTAPAM
jgi:hypothetical protein